MPLKLMYITNNCEVAAIAESAGVDRIFVDMEYIGKSERQGGMDTVQSRHTVEDVRKIRKTIKKAELLVRVNPIHSSTAEYSSSSEEIEAVIEAGADILMLPYFKTVSEVSDFLKYVNGRKKTMLLFETPESVELLDDIMNLQGIDEAYIGLNDLSLGYKKKFMFELLADGTVESICEKFLKYGVSYGFGGIAALGKGLLPAEHIIREHYRLGSTCVILSRSFCDLFKFEDLNKIHSVFTDGIADIRRFEQTCIDHDRHINNQEELKRIVKRITGE